VRNGRAGKGGALAGSTDRPPAESALLDIASTGGPSLHRARPPPPPPDLVPHRPFVSPQTVDEGPNLGEGSGVDDEVLLRGRATQQDLACGDLARADPTGVLHVDGPAQQVALARAADALTARRRYDDPRTRDRLENRRLVVAGDRTSAATQLDLIRVRRRGVDGRRVGRGQR